ncbi:hypothetical protein TNCV_4069541 [Trichonephila clavipes]|nr:hypothetical protein TNCV_4069541 [Trichonephila clavipes]
METSKSVQCEVVWILIAEGELDASIYQPMRVVYGELCLVWTIGAKAFVKDYKRYQILMTMPVETSPVKPRQP